MFVLVFVVCALLAAYVWLLQDFYAQKEIARELQEGVECRLTWKSAYGEGSETEPPLVQQWLSDFVGDDPSAELNGIISYPRDKDQLALVLHSAERLPHLERLFITGRLNEFRAIPGIRHLVLHGIVDDEIVRQAGLHETWKCWQSSTARLGIRRNA